MTAQLNKKYQDTIDLILSEVKDLKKLIIKKEIDLDIMKETMNLMEFKVSDLSCKIDFDISTLNITKVPKGKIADDKKPKLNIMSYFKLKYKENPKSLYSISSEIEINALLKKHEDVIKTKKDVETYKATLIYKELYKSDSIKTKMLRSMKEAEENKNTVIDPEIVENNLNDDDEPEPELSEEEEDDD